MNVERDGEGRPLPHHDEDEQYSGADLLVGGGMFDKLYPSVKKGVGMSVCVKVKILNSKVDPEAIATQGTPGAAAFDVYALSDIDLNPGETVIVPLGFAVEVPQGYDMKMLPRSGLSTKGVRVMNSPGLIDEDYRGELGVVLRYDPANTYQVIDKLYKSLRDFCKNLVSAAQFNIDAAKAKLLQAVNVKPFEPFKISAGDRIGQIQIQKVVPFFLQEVDELSDTERGSRGYGSTGA